MASHNYNKNAINIVALTINNVNKTDINEVTHDSTGCTKAQSEYCTSHMSLRWEIQHFWR